MTAPDRIAVYWTAVDDEVMPSWLMAQTPKSTAFDDDPPKSTRIEYIRKDMYDAVVAERDRRIALHKEMQWTAMNWKERADAVEAQVAKLEEALEKIIAIDDTAECCGQGVCGGYSPPECCGQPLYGFDRAQNIARTALE